MPTRELGFEEFKGLVCLSLEDMSRELYKGNRSSIKIKKEQVAVKNLMKIIQAALTLSNKKGFAAMSLRDLSREAGLSMGALYTYFTSKEDLLHMIQRQSAVVFRVLLEQIEGVDDPVQRLRRAIRTHLFLSEILQNWFYFTYMEAKNLAKEEQKKAIEGELATERIFVDIIRDGTARGVFRECDSELMAALIKAMLQDWYLKRWKYRKRKTDVESYAAFVADMVQAYMAVQGDTREGGALT
ncbi:MAG TPA: TetR/AcrR family transcriptional regulator [Deltaproteobacteria bacterium]|nr:TetR/AcrR family transcriptional regulator [Deltaproteobacteria bacterium]